MTKREKQVPSKVFEQPLFQDERVALRALEALRWPSGAVCPACASDTTKALGGASRDRRLPVYMCAACRKQFTVLAGTPLERSKVRMVDWWRLIFMMNSNRLNTISRTTGKLQPFSTRDMIPYLDVSYRTAWTMQQIVLKVLKTFNGFNTNFGNRIRLHIASVRPTPPGRLKTPKEQRRYQAFKQRRDAKIGPLTRRPKAMKGYEVIMAELVGRKFVGSGDLNQPSDRSTSL